MTEATAVDDPVVLTNKGPMKASALPADAATLERSLAPLLEEMRALELRAAPPALTLLEHARSKKARVKDELKTAKAQEASRRTAWDAVNGAADTALGKVTALDRKIQESEVLLAVLQSKQALAAALEQTDCRCPTCDGQLDIGDEARITRVVAEAKKAEAEVRTAMDTLRAALAEAKKEAGGYDEVWGELEDAVNVRTDLEQSLNDTDKEIAALEKQVEPEAIRAAEAALAAVRSRVERGQAIVEGRRRYETSLRP